MMNRERSARWKVSKYVIAVPILAFLMLAFNITKGKNFDKKNVFKELVKMAKSVEIVAEKKEDKVIDKSVENEEFLPIDFTPFKVEAAPVSVSEPVVLVKKDSVKITKSMTFQIWDFEKKQLAEGVKIVLSSDPTVYGVSDANGFIKVNVPDAARMFSVSSREHKFIEGLTDLHFTIYLKDGRMLWYKSDNFCEDLTTLGVSKFGVEVMNKLGGKTVRNLAKDNQTNGDITYAERQAYSKMLVVVNGEERTGLLPEDFDNLLVMYSIMPPKSITAYGEKGKNGVVVTKKYDRRRQKNTSKERFVNSMPNLDKYLEKMKNQSSRSPIFLLNGEVIPENYDFESLTKFKRVYVVLMDENDFDKSKIKDNLLEIRALTFGIYNIITVSDNDLMSSQNEEVSIPIIVLRRTYLLHKNIIVLSREGKFIKEIIEEDFENLPIYLDGKLITWNEMARRTNDTEEVKILRGNAAKIFPENTPKAETIIVIKSNNFGWEKLLSKMKELTGKKHTFYLFPTWSVGSSEPERLEIQIINKTNMGVDIFNIDFEKDPVIIVDGVRLRSGGIVTRNIDPESISSIERISPEKTKERFHENSATGAIIIKTKHL
jgi:hypothetical protein